MDYQEMTSILRAQANKIADITMEQIRPYCRDEHAVEITLRREMFVLTCIGANIATTDCHEAISRMKRENPNVT